MVAHGWEIVVTILVGLATLIGMAAVVLRWIYHQGAIGEQLRTSVDANTKATEDLSQNYKVFTVKIADQLMDHEKRLTRLETTTELYRIQHPIP